MNMLWQKKVLVAKSVSKVTSLQAHYCQPLNLNVWAPKRHRGWTNRWSALAYSHPSLAVDKLWGSFIRGKLFGWKTGLPNRGARAHPLPFYPWWRTRIQDRFEKYNVVTSVVHTLKIFECTPPSYVKFLFNWIPNFACWQIINVCHSRK